MRIQSTRVYTEVSKAIQNGYKVVSAQGSSRSSKTYNILIFLIAYVLQHPKTSLSVVRKTLPALKGSVFRDFKEIMQEKFKIWDNRSMNKSEMIYTLPNGSFVEFFSTDDEQKIRGRKRNVLYCNEANDISYLEWQQLVMRTTQFSIVDYNPSFTDEHWLCELNKDPRTYHFISTYKDNPFLEQTIIDEIESLQHKNKVLWTVYGLGQQAMAEGLIFPDFEIVDEFPLYAKHVSAGLDFGYSQDPTAIIKCGIVDDRMYLDEECYRTHMLAKEIISELKRIGLFVYADSADPRLIQEIANAGIVIYPADKYKGSVMGGLTKMMEYKLCVTRRSVNLIKELKNYVYGQNKDGKFINEPVDAYNHCFVGETMIETLSGIKRIDSIKVGEYVLTSDSYRKVSKFFDNGYKKILHIRLTFDNFVVDIKATPEHKIKTTKGWKQLQELTRGDVLYTYNPLTVKSINCIRENGISLVDAKDYIVRYGNHIMVTFQRAIMFITRMRTLGIMRLKTLNWSKGLNMFGFMQKSTKKTPISFVGSKQILTTQERSQTNGTNQTKDGNGIAKWLKNKPRISSQGNLSVNGVEKNLNLNQMDQIGSVPTSVKQLSAIIRVLTTKLESVKRVARNLFATNTVVPNIAVESVAGNITQTLKKESDLTPKIKSSSVKSAVRNTTADQQGKIDIVAKNAVLNLKWKRERAKYAESNSERENIQKRGFVASNVLADITVLGESTERVYDLEVEGMHEYFANGILVHNCIDAARYYTIGKLLGKVLTNRTYTKDDLGIY